MFRTMRAAVAAFAIPVFLLAACQGGRGRDVVAPGQDSAGYRRQLIRALERVHVLIATGDRDSMARLFPFPIPDSMLSIYIADTADDRRLKAGKGGVSRDVFDGLYVSISKAWQLDEFRKAFEVLDLGKLTGSGRVEHHVAIKTEPCYRYYAIDLGADSIVSISYGTNTNRDYKGAAGAGAAADEGCEFAIIWQFRFDGERLRLVRQTAAG